MRDEGEVLLILSQGVYYYRLLNHSLAEKWMSQALFLLKYYPDKTSYEVFIFLQFDSYPCIILLLVINFKYQASMYTGYSEVLKHVKPPPSHPARH